MRITLVATSQFAGTRVALNTLATALHRICRSISGRVKGRQYVVLKQLAHAAVAKVEGVSVVDNQLEVG